MGAFVIAVCGLALLVVGVGGGWLARSRDLKKLRKTLTDDLSRLRDERDTAIRAVRWVPLKDRELADLSKTGCKTCHGQGHYQHLDKLNGDVQRKALCQCVVRHMLNDAKYAFVGDGIPVRVATAAELDAILSNEKVSGSDGEADVIPIGAARSEVLS